MSQNMLPGSLAGTIRDTKGRVSRLERELSNLRREGEPAVQQIIPGVVLDPSRLVALSLTDEPVVMGWHPTGANLVGVSLLTFPVQYDLDKRPQTATMTIQQASSGPELPNLRPVNGVGGDPIERLPYSTWYEVSRIETARTWVSELAPVVVSMAATDFQFLVMGALFEFDTGPRQPSA